jgi:glycerol-3-phosphate O-acyltransferase
MGQTVKVKSQTSQYSSNAGNRVSILLNAFAPEGKTRVLFSEYYQVQLTEDVVKVAAGTKIAGEITSLLERDIEQILYRISCFCGLSLSLSPVRFDYGRPPNS